MATSSLSPKSVCVAVALAEVVSIISRGAQCPLHSVDPSLASDTGSIREMESLLRTVDLVCDSVVWVLLRMAVAIDGLRRTLMRTALAFRASLRRLLRRWTRHRGRVVDSPGTSSRPAWNRTPASLEEDVVALHVEYPHLRAGQLAALARRVVGFQGVRETVRRTLLRRQGLVVELDDARRRARRRIKVTRARELWGANLTPVWLLGFCPVWLLGVVDYHGSRLVALERLRWPTSAEVVRVLGDSFARHGRPERLLTDNGGSFVSEMTRPFLGVEGVRHSRVRPGHA